MRAFPGRELALGADASLYLYLTCFDPHRLLL
jgi:hypothetical protein